MTIEVLERHPHDWLMEDAIDAHVVHDDFRFVTPLALAPGLKPRP